MHAKRSATGRRHRRGGRPWTLALAAAVLAAAWQPVCLTGAEADAGRASLPELLARVAGDPAVADLRQRLIAEARRDARLPVLRRPRNLAELRQWRVPLKYDVRPPHMSQLADAEWEIFCLSQGDNKAGAVLKVELPRLAAAAALTGEAPLADRAVEQLEELATWAPLERRGWSLNNGKRRLSGDDGAWLGTGWLVRAIADTLELLPADRLPPRVRGALATRLEAEVAAMDEDWARKRPWYLRKEAAYSNQWILPHEALVRSCLVLGPQQRGFSYQRGVEHLLRSLDAQGAGGEFVEGLRYAGLSMESLYSIAAATARAGDHRLRRHPFLHRFPTWLAHHYQPGGFLINAFDSPGSSRGNLARDRDLLAAAAVAGRHPHALWALRTRAGFSATLEGLLAASLPASLAAAPPLWAEYPLATRLNWRNSWDDRTATGLWLRGGHASDFHDHMDRGHVNFIIGQRPLLIEAGTLDYAVPNNATHLRSVAGHNVLQIGDAPPEQLTPALLASAGQLLTPAGRAAPVTVERMDQDGGAARIDLSRCYAGLAHWRRRVQWDRDSVSIDDDVELAAPAVVQFRWHLGVPADTPAAITPGLVRVGDIRLRYTPDPGVVARVEPMPDATLHKGRISTHACVALRSAAAVPRLTLRTEVRLAAEP